MTFRAAFDRLSRADAGTSLESEQARVGDLQRLIEDLQAYPADADRYDREGFSKLLERAQLVLEVTDDEISRKLRVSRPTVGRWVRGETAPHPIGRQSVFRVLAEWAGDKLKVHDAFQKRKAAHSMEAPVYSMSK